MSLLRLCEMWPVKAPTAGRWLVPMASMLLVVCLIALGMVWRNQTRRSELAQIQAYVAQTAAIDALRQQLDRVVAETALRSQDRPLADLINRTRTPSLAAAPAEAKP